MRDEGAARETVLDDTPGHKLSGGGDRGTSKAAGYSASFRSGSQKALLLAVFKAAWPEALDSHEAAYRCGLRDKHGCCYWHRVGELEAEHELIEIVGVEVSEYTGEECTTYRYKGDAMSEVLVEHPAKFNKDVLVVAAKMLERNCEGRRVLDPFGGVGGAFDLEALGYEVTCLEIEPEWVGDHPRHVCTDALAWMKLNAGRETFDAIVTSPTYGNRMADSHDARDDSKRHTYRHSLGRPLAAGNSGGMQWGKAYRDLHTEAWGLTRWMLGEGGVFVLNVKDHIRGGEVIPVSEWHVDILMELGYEPLECRLVKTRGLRHGENAEVRVEGEWVYAFRLEL